MASWWDNFWWDSPEFFPDAFENEAFMQFVELDARIADDEWLQTLYNTSMFDMEMSARDRDFVYQALVDHLEKEYDIDFAAEFDWEGYREWYESA